MTFIHRFALTLLTSAFLAVQDARAITAEEIAQFLGISAWQTTVSLPRDSFTVDICEIVNGRVGEPCLRGGDEAAKDPAKGLVLPLGPRDGFYRLTLQHPGGIDGVVTKMPLFSSTVSTKLPAKIGAGDFILFGQTKAQPWDDTADARSYARGFVLRVTTKTATALEVTKARRCLTNARQIALACKLYANDHDGTFPTQAEELLPDYLPDPAVFHSPLAPDPEVAGYQLVGGEDTDPPSQVLVRGRFTTSDGRRSVVYVNQWATLEWR